MTWTSVVSYHTDPESCGVARFSAHLAARLGVPHTGWADRAAWGSRPLLSVKWAEFRPDEVDIYATWFHQLLVGSDQLWHDEPPFDVPYSGRVWRLYEVGVPALVEPQDMAERALFTFGMAHKIEVDLFADLRRIFFDRQLWISTAAHEGAGPSKVPELMQLWGPDARNLGHLSDAALELVWPRCLAFVAFFQGGLRANNSSVHAAMNARVPVITNHGPQTPDDLRHITIDLADARTLLGGVSPPSPYTWDRLLKELGCEPSR